MTVRKFGVACFVVIAIWSIAVTCGIVFGQLDNSYPSVQPESKSFRTDEHLGKRDPPVVLGDGAFDNATGEDEDEDEDDEEELTNSTTAAPVPEPAPVVKAAAWLYGTLDLEDNAPRPKPRKGEYDVVSKVKSTLRGVKAVYQHGRLGVLKNGTCCHVTLTNMPQKYDRVAAYAGFNFNSFRSDSLSVDRVQQDVRSNRCREKHEAYPTELPSASVIFVFHNELLSTLLRSVHSVLNLSPPQYLKEIILVDDASTHNPDGFKRKYWDRLQDTLAEHVQMLPKVRLARLKERRGLIVARMEGLWRASGDVFVFLDSHIEVTPGWLEPLLARIKQHRTHIVVPRIDGINADTFEYTTSSGVGVMGFTWELAQRHFPLTNGDSIVKSPAMAGGLLAGDRLFFLHLGGYDTAMLSWGGEEIEIGFRTWQCGGAIDLVPCSHVGHVFRSPNSPWGGRPYTVGFEDVSRNRLRTAEIWMDEYKEIVKLTSPVLSTGLGPLEKRRLLREKLGCKSFKWYLETVYPSLYVPKLGDGAYTGALRSNKKNMCVDTMAQKAALGTRVGAYMCHGRHGTQALIMDKNGYLRLAQGNYDLCIQAESKKAKVKKCEGSSARWKYTKSNRLLSMEADPSKCLKVSRNKKAKTEEYQLIVSHCDGATDGKVWTWMN